MVVVGTRPEYLNAVWVRNEWSRYLSLMKDDRKRLLIPCYRDMDPYDLPEQLSVLQSYDMSRIGFLQDLTRGISKVLDADRKPEERETVVIQGEGGVLPLNKEFVQGVAKFCKENDILLIVDEVQTGIGRCGSLFAYEQYGIAPDIVTMAKGLGGGLPIGGVLAAKSCADVMGPGTHGSTFGGNPVSAASANVVLDTVLKPGILKRKSEKRELI